MSAEIRRADWTIPYPARCNAERIPALLQSLANVDHRWEAFPWHLTGRLMTILENPGANYEYLHVTLFFMARAAILPCSNHVVDHKDLHEALCRYRVQFGGIYREHLLFHIRQHLKRHDLTTLPDCHTDELDPVHDAQTEAAQRSVVQRLFLLLEREVTRTLMFLSLATSMDEEVAKHPVRYWVSGAGMPSGVDVLVRVRRQNGACDIRPSNDEMKRMLREKRAFQKIVVKAPGCVDGDIGPGSDDRAGHHGRLESADGVKGLGRWQDWRIVGDYRMVVLPRSGKRINLARKHKARAVLRYIHQRLQASGKTEFDVEEMREEFNGQFGANRKQRQWLSDRFREDLFRGKEAEFDLLFESLDRAAGRYRLRSKG